MEKYTFKPSFGYFIVKGLIYSVLFLIFYEYIVPILYDYTPDLKDYLNINVRNGVLIGINFYFILKGIYYRIFYEYTITPYEVIIREGVFHNKTTIPISNRMIVNSHQNLFHFLLGLLNIEIEADGDASSPEGVLLHVNRNVFDILSEIRGNNLKN